MNQKTQSNLLWSVLFFVSYVVLQLYWLAFPEKSALFFMGNEYEKLLLPPVQLLWQAKVVTLAFILTLPLLVWRYFKLIIGIYVAVFSLSIISLLIGVWNQSNGDGGVVLVVPLLVVYFSLILLLLVGIPRVIQRKFLIQGGGKIALFVLVILEILLGILFGRQIVQQAAAEVVDKQRAASLLTREQRIGDESLAGVIDRCEIVEYHTLVQEGKSLLCLADGTVFWTEPGLLFEAIPDDEYSGYPSQQKGRCDYPNFTLGGEAGRSSLDFAEKCKSRAH